MRLMHAGTSTGQASPDLDLLEDDHVLALSHLVGSACQFRELHVAAEICMGEVYTPRLNGARPQARGEGRMQVRVGQCCARSWRRR